MSRHCPLYMYFVSLPHSVSAYSSMMSPSADVSVVAKSGPRPMSRQPADAAESGRQRREELRGGRLVAAALADELTLQRVEREDVVGRPRLVRAGRLLQERVDALAERVDVAGDLPALLARLEQHLGLGGGR